MRRKTVATACIAALLIFSSIAGGLNAADSVYFQQKVNYHIRANLIPALGRIEGVEEIRYLNCSPDTLRHIYFHLYLNRFRENRGARMGYQEVVKISDGRGNALTWQIDRTLLRLNLAGPLLPGDSLRLQIRFNAVLPATADRLGVFGDHLDVGNWYPVPVVYNAGGWQLAQHWDGEFFQEWGDYLVEITSPADFKIAATGQLVEETSQTDAPEQNGPSEVTRVFTAKNVHDFAFSADPAFRLRKFQADSTAINFWILPYREKDWEPLYDQIVEAFRILNREIGPYPYPELDIVDAAIRAGGMEYPGLVMINQYIYEPEDMLATVIHEIAHQWFYGLLANNQTRFGWMDEGWTTYWENLVFSRVARDAAYVESPPGFWGRYFGYWENRIVEDWRLVREDQLKGGEPVNRPFDWYQHDPFVPTYQKAAVLFSQLRYVMGDSLFFKGVRNYFQRWKFKHPSPEDMIACFEAAYRQPLDWFFEQWLNTDGYCDYKIKEVTQIPLDLGKGHKNLVRITLENTGNIQMPVDVRFYMEDGSELTKRIQSGAQAFLDGVAKNPVWPFKQREFVWEERLPGRLKKAVLNPDGRLFDVNPLNDQPGFLPPFQLYWLNRQYISPPLDKYAVTFMPDLFYSDYTGIEAGLKWIGYYSPKHFAFRGNIRVGHRLKWPSARLELKQPLPGSNLQILLYSGFNAGLFQNVIGLKKVWNFPKGWDAVFRSQWYYREKLSGEKWLLPLPSGTMNYLRFRARLSKWGRGYRPLGAEIHANLTQNLPFANIRFEQLVVGGQARLPLLLATQLDLEGLFGWSGGNLPAELQFRPGGAAYEDIILNPSFHFTGLISTQGWQHSRFFVPQIGGISSVAAAPPIETARFFTGGLSWHLGSPFYLGNTFIPYLSETEISLFTRWASFEKSGEDHRMGEAGIALTLTRLPFVLNYFDFDVLTLRMPVWSAEQSRRPEWKWRWNVQIQFRPFE